MIYATCVILGLIIGLVIGFVFAVWGQCNLEKGYVKEGVAKIDGNYYRIHRVEKMQ